MANTAEIIKELQKKNKYLLAVLHQKEEEHQTELRKVYEKAQNRGLTMEIRVLDLETGREYPQDSVDNAIKAVVLFDRAEVQARQTTEWKTFTLATEDNI